ncbi:hypothetical protein MA3A0930S_2725 [Mycobacteroides abscessus 3A-0930-S]|nr:hypothetical protein MA3A0122R_2759 [Mycobacteroides abscessus 3A-0122-R]EIV53292.1 hypothetical protein MA3A0930S_2725 [Mycobacteroides abscessus 3A-0930-S]EIV54411.1 hypothetical protein MA3A0930R_2796 [Mycobacteroides abscessus 3A-0930-R]EIV77950.1 hypothetical protein MM3A0810R_2792 [Mycobacteroides abscessus 3A-0810-R]
MSWLFGGVTTTETGSSESVVFGGVQDGGVARSTGCGGRDG